MSHQQHYGHQPQPSPQPPAQPPSQPPPMPMYYLMNMMQQQGPGGLPGHLQPQNQHYGASPFIQPSPETNQSILPTSLPNPQLFINPHHVASASISIPPPQVIPPVSKEPPPQVPYYDLPAGLMVPHVRLEDCDYKPLDPTKLKLPPPTIPSEKLLKAVSDFYAPPSHDRPRNGDGWEQLGLYEFYKAKSQAKEKNSENKSQSSSPERDSRRSSSYRGSSSSHRKRYRDGSPRRY